MLGSYLEANVLIKGGSGKGENKQSLSHENMTSCPLKMLFLFFIDTGVNLLGAVVCAYLFVVQKQQFSSSLLFCFMFQGFFNLYRQCWAKKKIHPKIRGISMSFCPWSSQKLMLNFPWSHKRCDSVFVAGKIWNSLCFSLMVKFSFYLRQTALVLRLQMRTSLTIVFQN